MTNINLLEKLKLYFGFDSFKGDQEAIIKNVLMGRDVFVLMPTGGGKSLCYQLPALLLEGTAIVVSPLIALMKNQVDAIRQVSSDDGIAHFLNSTLNKAELEKTKADLVSGRTKLLYVAPESLTKAENIAFLSTLKISFYAIDEAHCISEWGHDFRPEYRRLRPLIEDIYHAPVIALTATATDKVKEDIKKNLGMTDSVDFTSSFNRPNLYYEIRPKNKNVEQDICRFILQNPGKSGIVYCLSRKKVEALAEVLCANNINARPYHAGMDAQTRTQTQDDFIMERIDIIVATIAFGMGIDKPDVRFVIHYDSPKSLEGYYQETGRAGRDGGEGRCITYYSPRDLHKLDKFMEGKPIAEQEVGRMLLGEIQTYMESPVCRRKTLLHYFGEEYKPENCGNCDNCLHPGEKKDATEELRLLMQMLQVCKEKFRSEHIIDVLVGHETEDILIHKQDKLELYGKGDNHTRQFWNAVIRQAVVSGYAKKDVESYGELHLTPQGKRFINKPVPFTIIEENEFTNYDDGSTGGTAAMDEVLMKMLRDLRKEIAHKHNVPPYVIFQDNSLEEMATIYPTNTDDLQTISGVGLGKAQRYGAEFCKLIQAYCQENDIEPMADMRVRTVANKSKNKVSIVQGIDRQVAFTDLAQSLGKSYKELLEEIEAIVYSGTKLNIDYYINDVMDEDNMLDIYSYFREESETDDLEDAIIALGEDYPEEEIRLVRIKFLSEMAN